MMRLLVIGMLCIAAGCVGTDAPTMDPAEGYDAFGEAITPDDAVPVQVVAAEGEALIGQAVKLEGRIAEVCQGTGCWLTLQVVDGPIVRIDVPRDDNGAYVYTFPKDSSGRRAILAGVLQSERPHHEGAEEEDHHADGTAEMHHADGTAEMHHEGGEMEEHDDSGVDNYPYTLIATGALLERVRA